MRILPHVGRSVPTQQRPQLHPTRDLLFPPVCVFPLPQGHPQGLTLTNLSTALSEISLKTNVWRCFLSVWSLHKDLWSPAAEGFREPAGQQTCLWSKNQVVKQYTAASCGTKREELSYSVFSSTLQTAELCVPELLGKKRCTWGPSYWCKDVQTAQKCGVSSSWISDGLYLQDKLRRNISFPCGDISRLLNCQLFAQDPPVTVNSVCVLFF